VDQRVEPPEAVKRSRHRRPGGGAIGKIDDVQCGFPARRRDGVHRLAAGRLATRRDQDFRAFAREKLGGGATDAAPPSGHDCHPAGQSACLFAHAISLPS
jgi:hypothetical protein